MGDGRICVGRIGPPHGVRGLVTLQAFTAEPGDVLSYGGVETEDGRALAMAIRSAKKTGFIVEVAGVVDRDAAEALRGTLLYVPRGRLPEAGEEEWYHADLIGLQATDQDGAALGRVTAVHDFGAGDLLEIDPGAGETVLVPFTRDAVPEVDVASGRIVVRAPDPTEQPKPLPAKPRPAKTKGGNRP